MARTIAEIKATITTAFITNETIIEKYDLDTEKTFNEQFSKVSLENIWFGIVAMVLHLHEAIFDTHKSEVQTLIDEQEVHTLKWYKNLAQAFRFGYSLEDDSDQYSDEAIDDDTAAIIKHAAVSRVSNFLYMKVAKDGSGGLDYLTTTEKTAFTEYLNRTKDAGVNVKVISQEADHLRLVVDIWFDPQVLDDSGQRIDGNGDTTVQDAITTYLQNLPFNGEFTITDLTDALQAVNGVETPRVLSAQSQWGTGNWEQITSKYIPEAGWLKVYEETDLTIIWHANIQD